MGKFSTFTVQYASYAAFEKFIKAANAMASQNTRYLFNVNRPINEKGTGGITLLVPQAEVYASDLIKLANKCGLVRPQYF